LTPLSDRFATTREPDENQSEAVEFLGSLLGVLKPREQVVLKLRFGLDGESRHSLSQVGKALAITGERVRQIQDRALEKLRVAAAERDGPGPNPALDRDAGEALSSPPAELGEREERATPGCSGTTGVAVEPRGGAQPPRAGASPAERVEGKRDFQPKPQ
jgi:hypothetical protein